MYTEAYLYTSGKAPIALPFRLARHFSLHLSFYLKILIRASAVYCATLQSSISSVVPCIHKTTLQIAVIKISESHNVLHHTYQLTRGFYKHHLQHMTIVYFNLCAAEPAQSIIASHQGLQAISYFSYLYLAFLNFY